MHHLNDNARDFLKSRCGFGEQVVINPSDEFRWKTSDEYLFLFSKLLVLVVVGCHLHLKILTRLTRVCCHADLSVQTGAVSACHLPLAAKVAREQTPEAIRIPPVPDAGAATVATITRARFAVRTFIVR